MNRRVVGIFYRFYMFVEPFPAVLAPYARQTERFRQILLELAHARSAEIAARGA